MPPYWGNKFLKSGGLDLIQNFQYMYCLSIPLSGTPMNIENYKNVIIFKVYS